MEHNNIAENFGIDAEKVAFCPKTVAYLENLQPNASAFVITGPTTTSKSYLG